MSAGDQVELVYPADLFDVMVPEDDANAVDSFMTLFGTMFPRATLQDRRYLAEGLLQWRSRLLGQGIILHGLVAVPKDTVVDGEPLAVAAHWHVLAGVVSLGAAGELDAGEIATRYLGTELSSEHTYTESFSTRMGWGVGMVTTVPLTPFTGLDPSMLGMAERLDGGPDGGEEPQRLPERLGMAAALSAAQDATQGLLVVGLCLDSERVAEMGMTVAVIAGQSRILPGAAPSAPASAPATVRE